MQQDVFLLNPALASAIQACAALGDVDRGFRFFDAAVKRGSIPNLNVYSALLAVAGAAADPHRVQEVLDQMEEAGVEMNDITFHNLMSSYARGGHVTEALSLFDKMQKQGIPADEHTYAILMDAHAESGDFEGANALMEELKKTTLQPNLVHYNILLKACGKVSNLTSAFQLYEEMKERKIQPDLVTFITMMHAVYHGELGAIDQKKVKAALVGMGLMGAAFVPFINYEEYMMTTLFCGSLVGSMGLAAYMNPDGVIRALYPNTDEPRDDTIIEAFFRRLREEDHCGRSMYLWREMLKFNVPADPRVYDVLVRTCVRKRHPELAYEAVFEEKLPLIDKEGAFVLNLPTTLGLLHSLLAQKRMNMADTLYDAARSHNVFAKVFNEKGDTYLYDLRSFLNEQVRSYTIIKLLDELRAKVDTSKGKFVAPNVQFLVQHGYELLDRLDADNASLPQGFHHRIDSIGSACCVPLSGCVLLRMDSYHYWITQMINGACIFRRRFCFSVIKVRQGCECRAMEFRLAVEFVKTAMAAWTRCLIVYELIPLHGVYSAGTAYSCFDGVYSGGSTQEEVFEAIGRPFVADLLAGYNCTIIAYGQTGSGKTYSVVGGRTSDTRGLVPRAMEAILDEMARIDAIEYDVDLTASFIEIYQEKLCDLLFPDGSQPLRLREDAKHDVRVEGASEFTISTLAGGMAVLARGNAQRSTGSTLMNADSSRSHSVLTLTFTKKHLASGVKQRGKMFIVDLAGSEKVQKTAATGVRMDEAKYINKSLSALGNVINALTDEKIKHIPYRDSKLTRLLQSSLGGNAKTHLLLTCSANSQHLEETVSTLRFGSRAMNIQNSPHINNESAGVGIEYNELLTTLQNKIENLHSYIRQLESSRCTACKSRGSTLDNLESSGQTYPGADSATDLAGQVIAPKCVGEDPANDTDRVDSISDELMRAEMQSLRKTLTIMMRDHEAQEHANRVARKMMEVAEKQLDSRHRTQEETIKQQELELCDAFATISRLENKTELLEESARAMNAELHRLRGQQHQQRAGESAEAEILRRQLAAATKQAKQLQAKLIDSRQEQEGVVTLKECIMSKERELSSLRSELAILTSKKVSSSASKVVTPSLVSSTRSPQMRPVTAAELKTLATTNGNFRSDTKHAMSNIQKWWAGNARDFPTRNQEDNGEWLEGGCLEHTLPLATPSGASQSDKNAEHECVDNRRQDLLPPAESTTDTRGCNTANSSVRPFRARLVGLLNSLEEETTAYRELVVETKERAVSRGSSRPRRQLPCLDTLSSNLSLTTP
ncbi:unnamed protein product [Phytophthora lilii]|uniref:Unnamed protein product n=1 Tax=Phytophthora lilii TaxID=2077276 RepID=A0A9W6X528_9STRA|nr:unnamed protein product [Phytophthora lilii]